MATFTIEKFKDLVKRLGYTIYYQQAIKCECYNNEQPRPTCKLCHGSGYRYLPAKEIRGLATSLQGSNELNIQGLREPGTAYLTPDIELVMGYRDRVVFPDIEAKYSQTVDMLENTTTSFYREIKRVLFILQGDNVYEEDIDFVISKDKFHLLWISDTHKPEKGSKLSVLYMTSPSYLVMDLIHELRSTKIDKDTIVPYTAKLPNQYLIKREDFVYNNTVNERIPKILDMEKEKELKKREAEKDMCRFEE